MKTLKLLFMALLLTGCSAFQITKQPVPATTSQAEEMTRAQISGLTKMGIISATERGSSDDARRAIAAKANAMKVSYHPIIALSETFTPGV